MMQRKTNEIPGRQIPSQTDPLVEIRSAVHSNYAGMVAMLGADNRVYLGVRNAAITRICSHLTMTIRTVPCVLSVISPTCTIFSMEKAGRIPRRKCWNEGLPCASMKNLQDCKWGPCTVYHPKRNSVCRTAISGAGELSAQCRTL